MPRIDGIELMVREFEEKCAMAEKIRKENLAGGDVAPITIAGEFEYEEIDACCPPARLFGVPSSPQPISPTPSSQGSTPEDHHALFSSADSARLDGKSPGEGFTISPPSSNATSVVEGDPLPAKPPALPLVNGQA